MQKNITLPILFSFVIILALCRLGITSSLVHPVMANSATIYVPDSYGTIQGAVNAANPGDAIIVRRGIYTENVFLNKSLTLIGEDRNATIISGGHLRSVIHVVSPNVVIMNFTVQNSGNNPDDSGILLFGVANATIRNNIIKNNIIGVLLRQSNHTLLIDNTILNNTSSGIRLADASYFNYIIGNTLGNDTIGIIVQASFNTLYHNNFIENKKYQVQILGGVSNRWDDGIEGNYWSDYKGLDTNGDEVGDTDLPSWEDYYPLMDPWTITRAFCVKLGEETYYVNVQSYCTIRSFHFNQSLREISFRISGPPSVTFFCNVSVPKTLLKATSTENWLVQLNNTDITDKSIITENDYTSIYFMYNLSSYEVQIQVVKAGVRDFTPYIIGCGVAVAAIVITIFVVLKRKRGSETE